MKEQPKGPLGRATAVAEGVAAAVRRRQRDREPRVLLYRRAGDPLVLAPGAKRHDAVIEAAERMVTLVSGDEPARRRPRAKRVEDEE